MNAASPLLAEDEPFPVKIIREHSTSPFFLLADHAGRLIPRRLGTLGLPESEIRRHIGWDIGIDDTTHVIAEALDALFIGQIYSRLVIDCNRDPSVPASIAEISETTEVIGNKGLSEAERKARQMELFWPYHNRIGEELDRRKARGHETILVAMHSFTPVYKGTSRPWHVGILYNRDRRLAGIMLDLLRAEDGIVVGDNEPYRVSDLTDYTIPVHGERRDLPHVEIEIRQDLIETEAGQRAWGERFARLLPEARRLYNSR